MKKKINILLTTILNLSLVFGLLGCRASNTIEAIDENTLFSIPYGNFEEQISISDLNSVGNCRFGLAMRDGFFYIINGEAKKIMVFNSYGDLLTLFYNEDSEISKYLEKSNRPDASVHNVISFPFDYPGQIVVDSQKNIYTACSIPRERQEKSDNGEMLYSQNVLRISRNGSSVDYIGQQGPGGTPFPYIKNIYTTDKDELVVVSKTASGVIVYWFGIDGFLKYMIPIDDKKVPTIKGIDENSEVFQTVENVIPNVSEYKLYVKVDYYSTYFDEESKVQSGVNYVQTNLYELDIETSSYEEPITIPPYEESVVADYSRLTYKIPYDFLGVTKSGWKFFIAKTENGFNLEIIQNENQRMLRRHIDVNHDDVLFNSMVLSPEGLLSVLYIENDSARVSWYRTDSLIESLIK